MAFIHVTMTERGGKRIFRSIAMAKRKTRAGSPGKGAASARKARRTSGTPSSSSPAARKLREIFRRNGYIRKQSRSRLKKEGYDEYKKGDEVRLVAESKAELASIRKALQTSGFKPSRPFEKGRQWAQPIYGRENVARFLKLIG
jgi:hypothetical protein